MIVWLSTSTIYLLALTQIENGIDSLTRANTDNRFTYLLTYLLFFIYSYVVDAHHSTRVEMAVLANQAQQDLILVSVVQAILVQSVPYVS